MSSESQRSPQSQGSRTGSLDHDLANHDLANHDLANRDLANRDLANRDLAKLSVAAVARRLGVAPGTLRTWDRRYGLGPTKHGAGEHRKYTAADLARLRYMHKLVISGVTPLEAARIAISPEGLTDQGFGDQNLVPIGASDGQLVKMLFKAAQVLDRKTLEGTLRNQIVHHGVEATWINVLVPLLCRVGDEWERTGESIASEHMLTDVVKKVLTEKIMVENPRNAVPILLACVGEETHSLAITALAAVLAEADVQVQFLGARTPANAINEVVRRCTPAAIFLWAQLPENALIDTVDGLPSVRPSPRVILGGPGWAHSACDSAFVVANISEARQEILNALGF